MQSFNLTSFTLQQRGSEGGDSCKWWLLERTPHSPFRGDLSPLVHDLLIRCKLWSASPKRKEVVKKKEDPRGAHWYALQGLKIEKTQQKNFTKNVSIYSFVHARISGFSFFGVKNEKKTEKYLCLHHHHYWWNHRLDCLSWLLRSTTGGRKVEGMRGDRLL